MSFGQPSGPPATARQLRDLSALVEAAGHAGFRDARGPLGLTQRQAGGRFTRDEAEDLIARLEAEAESSDDADASEATDGPDDRPKGSGPAPAATARSTAAPSTTAPTDRPAAASRRQSLARQLERVPEDLLVEELRRRGWSVAPPGG
jgi:hypothetical protein